jgi:hypothetical protein
VYRELSTVDEAMGLPPPPPPAPGVYVPPKRSLDLLWSFNSPLTKGRNIACMRCASLRGPRLWLPVLACTCACVPGAARVWLHVRAPGLHARL